MIGSNKAFTLIEVLVATAIISIVMIVAVSMMLVYFKGARQTKDILYLESNARQIIITMMENAMSGVVAETSDSSKEEITISQAGAGIVQYKFAGNNIQVCEGTTTSCDYNSINPNDISIEGEFILSAVDSTDTTVITVTMVLQHTTTGATTPLIQTSFTPRVYAQ